ncbi:hypothetical protein pb186bvf_021024 [Paramecium bursaria]
MRLKQLYIFIFELMNSNNYIQTLYVSDSKFLLLNQELKYLFISASYQQYININNSWQHYQNVK